MYLWEFLFDTYAKAQAGAVRRQADVNDQAASLGGSSTRWGDPTLLTRDWWQGLGAAAAKTTPTGSSEPALLMPISLHLCRHTFASLLIDSGANPKAIQQFMATRKSNDLRCLRAPAAGCNDEVRKRMDAYLRGDRHVSDGG